MADQTSKKEITFEYPAELNDKNTLFTYLIRAARHTIAKDDRLKGNIRPLGDIELMSTTEAMKWMGIENMASFRNYQAGYEKLHGKLRVVGYQKPEDKRGPIYLREDLADLRTYVFGKRGISPFSEPQN